MTLKYKVIRSRKQYVEYSSILEKLVSMNVKGKQVRDEVDLLRVLIHKWDSDHGSSEVNSFADPVALVRSLMDERGLRARDLVDILRVSKGLVSDILNYKKGLSKENIRVLEKHFKIGIRLRYSYTPNISR